MDEQRLQSILAAFASLNIGLVGDLFLDRYLEIAPGVTELSIETALEAYQVTKVRNAPGALGTVMNNLAALGVGMLTPVTVIGDDGHGYDLLAALATLPLERRFIVTDPQRLTPTYTKPLHQDGGRWRELNRLDVRDRGPISAASCEKVVEHVRHVCAATDGLIVLDQINEDDWGVVNEAVRSVLAELARARPDKLIFIDSRTHLADFACGVLKGNRREICRAAGRNADDIDEDEANEEQVRESAASLARSTGQTVFCTCGADGMIVAGPTAAPQSVAGFAVNGPVDIVGAGDAATSGIVASLLAGASDLEAATIGNLAAAVTVAKLGTTGTASPEEILNRWRECL